MVNDTLEKILDINIQEQYKNIMCSNEKKSLDFLKSAMDLIKSELSNETYEYGIIYYLQKSLNVEPKEEYDLVNTKLKKLISFKSDYVWSTTFTQQCYSIVINSLVPNIVKDTNPYSFDRHVSRSVDGIAVINKASKQNVDSERFVENFSYPEMGNNEYALITLYESFRGSKFISPNFANEVGSKLLNRNKFKEAIKWVKDTRASPEASAIQNAYVSCLQNNDLLTYSVLNNFFNVSPSKEVLLEAEAYKNRLNL